MRSMLDLVLDMGHERGLKQGLEQGLQQGLQQALEALRQILAGQLRTRFGEVPAAHAAQLAAANLPTLQAFADRLLRVERIEHVFESAPAPARGKRRSPRR